MDTFDIVVDAQADFMRPNGKLYVAGAEGIIPAMQHYLANLDSQGVLFTFDTHLIGVYEHSEEAKQFSIHCIKDSEGWQLVVDPSVVKVPIYTLQKGVFDMWNEAELSVITPQTRVDREVFFKNLKSAGVKRIRLTGVAADYCVKWAIDGLIERGFQVEVIDGLTVGIQRSIEQVLHEDFANKAVSVIGPES